MIDVCAMKALRMRRLSQGIQSWKAFWNCRNQQNWGRMPLEVTDHENPVIDTVAGYGPAATVKVRAFNRNSASASPKLARLLNALKSIDWF